MGWEARWRERRARKREERESGTRDVLSRARARQASRHARIAAQEGEPLWRTLLRVLYLTACVVVDGVVLLELVRLVPGALGWGLYLLALVLAVPLQVKGYRRWFDPVAGRRASPDGSHVR